MDFDQTPHLLPDYGLLGIRGKDTTEFLQGVITNDMGLLNNTAAIYAAHLTPQGRIIADFLVTRLTEKNRTVLCLPRSVLLPLAKSLHTYAIGMDIEFEDLTDTYTIGLGTHPDAILTIADPRPLPFRLNWSLFRFDSAPNLPDGTEPWQKVRVQNCLPSAPQDLFGKPLPAEWNFEHLGGVSFSKGCYVGQEVTTRMHHRTEPKKTLYNIELENSSNLKTGDAITTDTGVDAGWLLSVSESSAMALLRKRVLENSPKLNGIKNYEKAI
jgi:folate-binding protein YgfZ